MNFGVKHKIILLSALSTFIVFAYDSVFHILFVILHGLFEWAEYFLDGCIEHLLETSTHETQVIVFYILVSLISYGLYRFYCSLPHRYQQFKNSLVKDKAEILTCWHALSFLSKIKYTSIFLAALSLWFYFGF